MTMTIHATFAVSDIDELHELMTSLRELEPAHIVCDGCVTAIDDDADEDQTPPFGTERPPLVREIDPELERMLEDDFDGPAREEANVRAREVYITALMMWTREHITEGPISEVSDAAMRDVYRSFLMFGDDAGQHNVTLTQLSCLRGAFKDATAGQVPL